MATLPTWFTTLISDLTAQDAGLALPVAVAAMVIGGLLHLAADDVAGVRRSARQVLGLSLGGGLALGLAHGLAHLLLRLTGGA